jgi:hypothetical protein
MIVPGSNLLNLASQLIAFQEAKHWRNRAVVEGGDGINAPTYYPAEDIFVSIQPVPRNLYEMNGLDLQREYVTVYASTRLHDVRRDKAPDMVDFAGDRYTVESNEDWRNQDGWLGSICVKVGPADD